MTDISPEAVERATDAKGRSNCKKASEEAGNPYPCSRGCPCALELMVLAQAARIAELERKLHQSESTRRAQIKTINGEKKKRLAAWNAALDAAAGYISQAVDVLTSGPFDQTDPRIETLCEYADAILALKTETPT
ncbi:hypothetical protein ACFQFQ_14485 [Sulfitobacter porphyrae]|uniref:Uncharacterized protein n=1 Tax=Sulfitobacter porphyrae TaxID=1246864 RepID=A0ABW2B3V8_9RHOB|nr:hypothetical protein GCM10007928_01990 [Sulfitobacter porphyrae]